MEPESKSDLDHLRILEDWATLSNKMGNHAAIFPESSNLVANLIYVELDDLWKAFEKGLVVRDDANSMKALQIAAKLRNWQPQYHMMMDKIAAQKLRRLSIRQAGKSDVSQCHVRSYCISAHRGHSLP